MSTVAQKSANVANSSFSTGPRTAEGKRKAAANSGKHYLTSKQVVIPGEDPEAYDSLHTGLVDSWNPANPQEELLVGQIAQSAWRLQRVRRMETATFAQFMPSLEPVLSSSTSCVKRVPRSHDEATVRAFENASVFDNLRRYETTIERGYYRGIAALEKLQKERKKSEIGSVSQNVKTAAAAAAPTAQIIQPEIESAAIPPQSAPKNPSPGDPQNICR